MLPRMSVEGPVNSFRASVLAGHAGRAEQIVQRVKHGKLGGEAEGLGVVQIPRSECRRGNQRDGDRHRLEAEQAILTGTHGEAIVEVVNLSAGGAMISTELELALWDHVGLVLGDEDAIDCAVRWLKGRRVGLEFAEETRLDCDSETRDALLRTVIRKSFPDLCGDPLYHPKRRADDQDGVSAEEAQRRSAERHPLIWNGTIYQDCESETVRLRNISASGALVQASKDFIEGATVYLDLGAAGQMEAVVRWTRGGQAGLSFSEEFDIRRLAAKAPDVAGDASHDAGGAGTAGGGWNRVAIDHLARQLGG